MMNHHQSPLRPAGASRRLLLTTVLVGMVTRPALAQAPTGAADVVGRLHNALIDVMRQATRLGVRGRFDALRPVMDSAFDLPAMARIAVGLPWSTMTPDQQNGLVRAFAEWSIATYANRFNGYSGESFSTAGESTLRSGDQMVRTALNRANGQPVLLNYLLRRATDSSWRIVDIYLTGTISELASRRADFATVLAEGGPDRLTAELRRRSADLLKG